MKAYIVDEANQTWKLEERPDPTPGLGEVLVRVRACSLNYRDLLITKGRYFGHPKKDCIPLSDGAGDVLAVGKDVSDFKVGDRVVATFFQNWRSGPPEPDLFNSSLGGSVDGMLAEKVLVKASGLLHIPPTLTYEEAATLPCAALTAWSALFYSHTPLKPGSSVLTLGTGGVSIFAIQFAKAFGLRVISTSGSDAKLEKLKAFGIDHGINYKKNPDWHKEVKTFTEGKGVDQVIEVGGDTLFKSLDALKYGGLISFIGVVAGAHEGVNPLYILKKGATVQAVMVGSYMMFKEMLQAMETAHIKPVIDQVFNFDQAKEALAKLESGSHFGKIIIKI